MKKVFFLVFSLMFPSITFAEAVWVDVRTVVEHKMDRIEGDVRITHTDIVPEIQKRFPDKSTEIHLYCRSGGRAGKAMNMLKQAGYTNVSNAGGIDDARRTRKIVDE